MLQPALLPLAVVLPVLLGTWLCAIGLLLGLVRGEPPAWFLAIPLALGLGASSRVTTTTSS